MFCWIKGLFSTTISLIFEFCKDFNSLIELILLLSIFNSYKLGHWVIKLFKYFPVILLFDNRS